MIVKCIRFLIITVNMNIEFAPSFWKSLRKMRRYSTWWYKTYKFFRYNLPNLFKNLWNFKKELYLYRPWDNSYTLRMLRRGLELQCDSIERFSNEVDNTRMKKVAKMKRAIEILKWHSEDLFIELAEKELGYEVDTSNLFIGEDSEEVKLGNRKIFTLARDLEEESSDELWKILKGQDYKTFNSEEECSEQFDGSGIRNWWN